MAHVVVQPLHRRAIAIQPNGCSLGEFRELAKSKITAQPEIIRTIIKDARTLSDQPGKRELVEKLKTLNQMRSLVPEHAWHRFVHRALRRAGSTFAPFDNLHW